MKADENPRLPEVGESIATIGTLVRVDDVTPPAPAKVLDYIFASVSYRVEMRAGGKLIDNLGEFIDHIYGEGVGLRTAIEEAKEKRRWFKNPAGVVFQVVKVTSYGRMRPTRRPSYYDAAFFEFESIRAGCKFDVPDDTEEVVWSSETEK